MNKKAINGCMCSKLKRRKLDRQEVERSIFIDYEGNTNRAATLLGWLVDRKNFAAIIESDFSTCAHRYRAKHVALQDHHKLAKMLIKMAEQEDRVIVSWSEHDLQMMLGVLDEAWQQRLLARYRNALRTVRPWHQRSVGTLEQPATLAYFSEVIGFQVPEKFGQGVVGDGLRLIRDQIAAGRSYSELTPKARAAWVNIVKHNRYDLEAMEAVLFTTTSPEGRSLAECSTNA